ncbi:hypothetical protein L915_11298, partial [Phytophthora nicotianae]
MANCIKALVAFDRRKQNDYEYRLTRIGRFSNSNYDEEMSTVLRFTTHYAACQIERQYILGLENASRYNFEKDPEELSVVKIEKNPPASSVSIRLNPKARKVGAPKKAKKKIVAGERADRKWYEAAKEGRKKAGEVTLLAVVNSLDHVQPGLRE